MRPIAIAGPPGVGKSTVGKLLARELRLPFVDVDHRIEQQVGRSPADLIRDGGELAFRVLEERTIAALLAEGQDGVWALGGGALTFESTRRLLLDATLLIGLRAPLRVLLSRLGAAADRPLLDGDTSIALAHLLDLRTATYEVPPIVVDASPAAEVVAGSLAFRARAWREADTDRASFVPTGPVTTSVVTASGALRQSGTALRALGLGGGGVLLVDTAATCAYGDEVARSLEGEGLPVARAQVPNGEAAKDLSVVEQLTTAAIDAGLDRDGIALAIGGGSTGDVVGLAAAVLFRGIGWGVVPTTLLSMVDASLGGKTAVDHPRGKNLVGTIHPPKLIVIDPSTLDSLPTEELTAGKAEVLKHGLLGDQGLLDSVLDNSFDPADAGCLHRALNVKAEIVSRDPFERGIREHLNLGHTIAHAIERATGHVVSHGHAVGLGLLAEARLGLGLGITPSGIVDVIEEGLRVAGLPRALSSSVSAKPADLVAAARHDKKRREGHHRVVLLEGFQEPRVHSFEGDRELQEAFASIQAGSES